MTEAANRQAFFEQVGWCKKLGSPFTALLLEVLGERLDRSTAVGRRLLDWPGPAADLVPLRIAGALHALVLRGVAPALAKLYPPNPLPDGQTLWAALEPVLAAQDAVIQTFLDQAPQTNEVGRAGPLMVGLLAIARQAKLPMALYEVGASAGLNLNLARFGYTFDGLGLGDQTSGVQITPEWEGAPPPRGLVTVTSRRGVDVAPLSALDPADREKLMAYVWADQTARLARLKAALDIAQAYPPNLDQGDAADWVEKTLAIAPVAAICRVLFHTVAFQYFPPDSQARLRAHVARIGAAATAQGPFAWLRYEADSEFGGAMSLRLTLWPTGEERVLGVGHAHGASFKML